MSYCKVYQVILVLTIFNAFKEAASAIPSADNAVPLLGNSSPDAPPDFSNSGGDSKNQKSRLEFRLANRLAVAVCDTYDTYLATGKPYTGQINYNITVQVLRSPVPPSTCQSFKIKRCKEMSGDNANSDCGWTKVATC